MKLQQQNQKHLHPSTPAADHRDGSFDDGGFDNINFGSNPLVHWFEDQASWMTSMVVHAVLLIVLVLVPLAVIQENGLTVVASASLEPIPEIEEIEPVKLEEDKREPDPRNEELPEESSESISDQEQMESLVAASAPSQPLTVDWSPDKARLSKYLKDGFDGGPGGPGPGGDGIHGCRPPGGIGPDSTPASEDAVDLALQWLAAHQLQDGSWNFDHRQGDCQGRCDKHGSYNASRNAATAIALLTFLGAGETHLIGDYQANVNAGLKYLLSTMKMNDNIGSWHEKVGNSYSHGLATLAITEAFAMSSVKPVKHQPPGKSPAEMAPEERKKFFEDKKRAKEEKKRNPRIAKAALKRASQAALNWIRDAQDTKGGGWRYHRGQAGDTSVVGWMLMGLKSGYNSRLHVDRKTVAGASQFLDSVQMDDYGSMYRYTAEGKREASKCRATTAIGLLCRMYLGWSRDHPGISQGAQQLDQWGPSTGVGATNMYYNYYATQVMHHYGGDLWTKNWNPTMRDYLVSTQAKKDAGHMAGSWHFGGDHGSGSGGRLYCTALAAMTLEVYYRYMPIYASQAVEDDFKIDGEE